MLVEPSLDELLTKVDSKFKLVTLALKRARQINDDDSADQQYNAAKPVSMALQEIYTGEVYVDTESAESKEVKAKSEAYDSTAALAADSKEESISEDLAQSVIDSIADEASCSIEDFVANVSENISDASDSENDIISLQEDISSDSIL